MAGQYSTKRAGDSVTLSTQRSEYAKVHWDETVEYAPKKDDLQKNGPQGQAETHFEVDAKHAAFTYPQYTQEHMAFWGYTCHFSDRLTSTDTLNAFYFDQVRVHQSRYYEEGPAGKKVKTKSLTSDMRDVFSQLGFHSLKVKFEDAAGTPPQDFEFKIADYITARNYKLRRSWGGHIGSDHLYQTGWPLVLVEDKPKWPRLEVELSLVMRGPAPDFDPGGVAEALKCYPQIQFKWFPRPGVTVRVAQFEGTVRAVVNTKHYSHDSTQSGNHFVPGHQMGGMSGMGGMDGMDGADTSSWNDVSCFADSNLSANYYNLNTLLARQDMDLPSPGTKPTWAALFDYYLPHVAQGPISFHKDFVGAYRHDPSVRSGQVRKMYVDHKVADPPCVGPQQTPIFITKFPRQGGMTISTSTDIWVNTKHLPANPSPFATSVPWRMKT